jgi:thiamine biosynthesis protein ThiS
MTHLFITLNGEPHELSQPLTIAELLDRLAIDRGGVAVLHNLEILRRRKYAETAIRDGDRVEIVTLVGGG